MPYNARTDVEDVKPAVSTLSVWQLDAWHQQQWLVAFEVLVSHLACQCVPKILMLKK